MRALLNIVDFVKTLKEKRLNNPDITVYIQGICFNVAIAAQVIGAIIKCANTLKKHFKEDK